MIGGLSTMVPERRLDVISMGFPAVWVGLLTTLLTAAVIGTLV